MNFQEIIKDNLDKKNFKIRYWSYIMETECDNKRYYIKIPKKDALSNNIFLDIQDEFNRKLGINEYQYLNKLCNIFSENNDQKLSVVKPVEYNEKFNAIIIEEFKGESLYKSSRYNCKNMAKYYSMAGRWLDIFHKNSKLFAGILTDSNHNQRLYDSIDFLEKHSHKKNYVNKIKDKIDTFKYIPNVNKDIIIEGFELRNFLINNNSLCFLDPTLISNGCILDDIARFLVSIDMLYWDRIDAYFSNPCEDFKQNFLDSLNFRDYDKYIHNDHILSYYIIKWLLLRWKDAYVFDAKNGFYSISKPIISKYYVDHLFCKWIDMYIENI